MTATPAQQAIKTMNQTTSMSSPKYQTTPPLVSSSPSHKLDPIAVLREELAAAAVCHGVERVEDLTEALVSRVVQRLGGAQVYVPTERSLYRERIAQEIRNKFDGRNVRQLANSHGLSVRRVLQILEGQSRVRC